MARVVFCESCGAPLDAPWKEIVIVCSYCGAQNLPGQPGQPVPPSMPADGRPRLNIGGRTYVIEGRIARGDSADVYRARWVMRLGELVVVKILRSISDEDLMRREWSILRRLWESRVQGSDHFTSRLPQPIAMGPVLHGGHERLAAVFRWQSGFVHTLEDVIKAHPLGIDGRVAAWLGKRMAELLGWVHREGVVHGAVVPAHVLVHPLDHGANLVGWGSARAREGQDFGQLDAVSRRWAHFHGGPATHPSPRSDVVMAARCALAAWGEHPDDRHLPDCISGPLALALRSASRGEVDDAWRLRDAIDEAARQAFGPPSYNPLPMPGW